jgi:hypothetical protein
MNRRNFFRNTAIGSVAFTGLAGPFSAVASETTTSNSAQFKLKYAPGFGMFREHAGNDPIDQIKFMSDQGFRAIFDNGFMGKEPALQEKIVAELSRHNMEIGPYVFVCRFQCEINGYPRSGDYGNAQKTYERCR